MLLYAPQAKRDSLFRDKVIVKDAEEKASAEPIVIARQLVLPLPRTYGEAAEWATRYVFVCSRNLLLSIHLILSMSSSFFVQAQERVANLRHVSAHDFSVCGYRCG